MSRIYTAESPIHGTGVFSASAFSPGEIVLKIDDSRVVSEAAPLDPAKGEFGQHCDYLSGGKVVLMQSPERFINHRCDPNTFTRTIAGDRYVVALREIRPGDEITYDYCLNSEGDTAWDCSCGSPDCRKHHLSGFFHLPVDVQALYLALLEDWFVAEHRDEVEALKRRVDEGLR
jgi:SET domain-containing protein